METTRYFQNWQEKIVYPAMGAQPVILDDTEKFKVILGGLECGQKIPNHPESQGIYYILEGHGTMTVNEEIFAIDAGAVVITPEGAFRAVEAKTRLAFLAIKIK